MNVLEGKRVYVHANCFIYLSEKHPDLGPMALSLLRAAYDGFCMLVTSDLTLAEVLVLPLKVGNERLQAQYIEALSPRSYLEVWGVSRSILMASAKLLATAGNKLPDAIHVATAISSNCSVFVSEDRGIRVPDGLMVIRVSELGTILSTDNP